MKISNPKRMPKNSFYLITVAVLVAAVAWMAYAYTQAKWPFESLSGDQSDSNAVNYDPATDEEVKAGEETTEQNGDEKNTSDDDESTDQQTTTTPGPQSGDAGTVSITVASQQGQTYQIRTLIITSEKSGACRLTVQRNGIDAYSKRVQTQMVAGNSTCQGFDFDTANIAAGAYRATVTYANSNGSTSTYEDITIK